MVFKVLVGNLGYPGLSMNALFTSFQSSIFLIKNGKVDLSKILESLPALFITYIFPTQVQNCQVLVNHSNYLIIRSLHVHVTSFSHLCQLQTVSLCWKFFDVCEVLFGRIFTSTDANLRLELAE